MFLLHELSSVLLTFGRWFRREEDHALHRSIIIIIIKTTVLFGFFSSLPTNVGLCACGFQ